MPVNKYNFVDITRFLRLNPQFSEKDRAEILKLNDPTNQWSREHEEEAVVTFPNGREATIEEIEGWGRILFDKGEIRNFFQSYEINYKNLYSRWTDSDWKEKLGLYIAENLEEGDFFELFDASGFPIPEGKKIGEDPSSNLLLVLDYAEQKARSFDSAVTYQWIFEEKNAGPFTRFDDLDYPQTPLERDRTGLSLEELQDFQKSLKEYYALFAKQLGIVLALKANGYQMDLDPRSYTKMEEENGPLTPWGHYSFLLARAICGDQTAIDELWAYHEGGKKLESQIQIFDEISEELLDVGKKILLRLDPERFHYKVQAPAVGDQTIMGMAEFEPPNPEIADLKEHLVNPADVAVYENPRDRDHPTMTSQTLLATGSTGESTGRVKSYVLDLDDKDIWEELDRIFGLVLEDLESGERITVINFSVGTHTGRVLGKDFDELMGSEIMTSIREKLTEIEKRGVNVVIAAGNYGEQISRYGKEGDIPIDTHLLSQLNFLAVISPAIIVVGSTRTEEPANGEEELLFVQDNICHLASVARPGKISLFSSEGNPLIHPDVVAEGEGQIFHTLEGIETDVDGTSFSAPRVARLIAAMSELNPLLTPEMRQAILKMTAEDILEEAPEREGAGKIVPEECLYVAFALNRRNKKEARQAYAETLGISTERQQGLDWLSKRIKWRVFWQDANRQNFGE